ncbi:SKP1-like protein 4 [Rhododendron vialii]|uniref:SKP1-like protein 4 n=1 Tax=Rhododendron vialii TaxID=182163 RepID=UPI00265ECB68|nr:SKP1-like protein 4 [Rhododendron vialii]
MSSRKKLTLQSSDGQTFELEESVETMCSNLRNVIRDKVDCASSVCTILVPGVDGKTLATVIEQCKKHANTEAGGAGDDLERCDLESLGKDDQEVLVPLFVHALLFSAICLDVKDLAAAVVKKI